MRKTLGGLTVAVAALATGCGGQPLAVTSLPRPGNFATRIDNPWFPLLPATVLTYRGVKDGRRAVDVVTVTNQHRMIEGIPATVIKDRLYLGGVLEERTADYYAQDRKGNVWYLGESTATLDRRGRPQSTEGSWLAGVNGARAGIYMPANPEPGRAGRQEYYRGHAEDQYKVLSLGDHVSSPAIASKHALLTQETTRLEPGVVDHKVYVRGFGTVVEDTVHGPTERLVLDSVQRRP
jgi:hypothetical protein